MAGTVEYDVNHFLLTFGGYLVGGHEQWQCGLRFTAPGNPISDLFKAALEHISITDIYDDIKPLISSGLSDTRYDQWTTLEFAKLAAIGKDGLYLDDPIEHRAVTKGLNVGSFTVPPQLALVISLATNTKIGFANHGRYFMPAPVDATFKVDPATGQVAASVINNVRGLHKTMLEAVTGEVSTAELPMHLAIMSPKTPKSVHVTAPSHKHVERMGIGWAVDTQRSRRRSLPDGITTWETLAN